ncbi:hypothetical protein E2C01_053659 [Portunus trituberculatus]|uniref:Uncharacterized protein n=1 Tax=Portunus trituberculatus TaxID=210409 RepID=A0A5B7GQQ1_PORTR|nr:hypothetical protein [Portunus trituberculatus]
MPPEKGSSQPSITITCFKEHRLFLSCLQKDLLSIAIYTGEVLSPLTKSSKLCMPPSSHAGAPSEPQPRTGAYQISGGLLVFHPSEQSDYNFFEVKKKNSKENPNYHQRGTRHEI